MASGALITYLGTGVAASRPATPDTFTGIPSLYYATDTDTLSVWDGSTWEAVGGGGGTNREVVTVATSTSNVLTIDWSAGNYFTHALDENISTWSITNLPSSPAGIAIVIQFTQDSTPRTVAWPASFRWVGGTDGVVSTGSGVIDTLSLISFDQGTTWLAYLNNGWAT